MSYKTKAEALEAARRVAKELGAPWKPDVWENLGWHASVSVLGGYLHPEGGGLSCYIDDNGYDAYSVMGINTTLGWGHTPTAAVRKAKASLRKRRREIDRLLGPLES